MDLRHGLAMQARLPLKFVLVLLLLTGMEERMLAAEKDNRKQNKDLVQAAFDAWHNGVGGVFDLLSPDAKWTIVGNSPVSKTYTSRQEFMDAVIAPFNARLSERLIPTVRNIYADGDMVIALFDGKATARDGKPYQNTYTWYMKMRGEKIVEAIAFFDTMEFTDFWTRIKPGSVPNSSAHE